MDEINGAAAARQAAIIEAAKDVFQRYGFKKTSMDDLARAAGLSRQGLYLHFPNKQALFKAMVMRLLDAMRMDARAALARDDVSVEERVLDAFVAMFGKAVGSDNHDELFATIVELVGTQNVREIESEFATDMAQVLLSSGVIAQWKEAGYSAMDLAELLFAASDGIKRRARTSTEYRDRMRIAIRLVCRGAPN